MVAAALVVPSVYNFNNLLCIGQHQVQQQFTSSQPVQYLNQKVIINGFQEPPGPLGTRCVVSPSDIWMVEVPHQDESL